MASITGGTVNYHRTVKVSDYEPKKAEVTLSFGVDEGEDVEKILDYVSQLALRKTHQLLGIPVPAETKAAATEQTKKTVEKGKVGAAAMILVEETQKAAEVVEEPTAAEKRTFLKEGHRAADPVLLTDVVEDELDVAGTDITDAALTDAAKSANKRINDPVKIKALRDKYTGKTPSILAEIPKDKRQEFLDELTKLK